MLTTSDHQYTGSELEPLLYNYDLDLCTLRVTVHFYYQQSECYIGPFIH